MVDISHIPKKPGCYFFRNSSKKILYIGKAKNLYNRVSSYFKKEVDRPKTEELVKHIHSVEFVITDSEIEALLLESRLIKQYKPKYNIDLKHNERYAYIKVTNETYPRIITARKKRGDGVYFGPFISGYNRVLTIKTLNQVFALKTCKGVSKKPCFNSHIGLCSCPDHFGITPQEYKQRIAQAITVLKGNTNEVVHTLESEMKHFAKTQSFELAKQRRDQIKALEDLEHRQKIESDKEFDQDVVGVASSQDTISIFIFCIEKGIMNKKEHFTFSQSQNPIEEFLMQYYEDRTPPKQIIIEDDLCDAYELISQALSTKVSYAVTFVHPKIGQNRQLLDLATQNAYYNLEGFTPGLYELQKILELPTLPKVIECYDISNLRDSYIVGAKVQLTNGEFDKKNYRRYRIKWQTTQNDFLAMYEVLKRRLRPVYELKEDPPNILVIDGGPGQLSSARRALVEYNLSIPIISLSKKEETIHFPTSKKPISTSHNQAKNEGIRLLIKARDEVHRYVISYHRTIRDKVLPN